MSNSPTSDDASPVSYSQRTDASNQAVAALGQRLMHITERLLTLVTSLSEMAGRQPTPDMTNSLADLREAMLMDIQRGQADAVQLERATRRALFGTGTTQLLLPQTLGGLEHPLVRLAHAYRAAFDAQGVALLLLADDQALMPSEARGLVDRAAQAARLLGRLTNLIYHGRGLGSVAHLCENVGMLENQADALYRSAVSALFGSHGPHGVTPLNDAHERVETRWTAERAWRFHLLCALEALTDRCEDIADELMLVDYALA
jgi:hypothetical protein